MLRDILSGSRAILVGLVFFVLIVGGSLLYSWHVHRTTDAEVAETQHKVQPLENKNETRTAADTTDTSRVGFEQVGTDLETHEKQPMSDDTDVSPIDETSETLDMTDAFLPDDFVAEEEPAEDVPVSPFGFGPYPEIPADYAARHGQTVWQYPGSLPRSNQRNIELIHRVMIASWNEGDTQFISATFEDGKVYLQYPNTMYVRYTVHEGADGTVQRRIGEWTSGEHNQSAIDQILEGKIPTGVTLIDMDSEDFGIDPYTFLGLK